MMPMMDPRMMPPPVGGLKGNNLAPVVAKPVPKPAPVVAKPVPKPAPVVAKPAPVVAKPVPKPAPVVAKPAPVVAKPAPAPKPTGLLSGAMDPRLMPPPPMGGRF